MINFIDFVPEVVKGPNIWGIREMEALEETKKKMNDWIETERNIKIISIETVVLPNIHHPKEEGSTDPELRIRNEEVGKWYQFFRVWYKTW